MDFKRVCRALYKYEAVEEGELSFEEEAIIYIWDDSNEEWWRASLEMAQNESELVTGLIPYNYVEEMEHLCKARALYDYEALNNDELSFKEGAEFLVYQKDGEDWMMVNYNGVFGFVPQSYVEEFSEDNFEDQGYLEPTKPVEQVPVQTDSPDREPVSAAPILAEPSVAKKSLKDDYGLLESFGSGQEKEKQEESETWS
ncbi:cytoskeletal protein binding protein [Entomophthora muscae]|uniref:Cytoskeletal protein binding protein n=1 Tax=Entomophthora muscae TaxID=34485 RepID=A0ACC2RGU1_9FUNG|nr:cytoskeletal protein binding protein [Entomophthora muscae]